MSRLKAPFSNDFGKKPKNAPSSRLQFIVGHGYDNSTITFTRPHQHQIATKICAINLRRILKAFLRGTDDSITEATVMRVAEMVNI